MQEKRIALVTGDGAAPEMMRVACVVAKLAARYADVDLIFEETPMGWNAFRRYGDTLPPESLKRAIELGIVFFGGVGTPEDDATLGASHPAMKPETRCLMGLRNEMGLLLNFRPVIYTDANKHLARVKIGALPLGGIRQEFVRFLLQDSYFGTVDLWEKTEGWTRAKLGLKQKHEVDGNEDMVSELSYYSRAMVEKYFHAIFAYARKMNLPVICVDKANIMARYLFWRMTAIRVSKQYPDVPFSVQLVDSANALLFTPERLQGVIACGNEHGDILSDGAIAASGSMGLMHSSSINPDTGAAMFESGAGTAPELAGKDNANPIGRILTAAMMLDHIGLTVPARAIRDSVDRVLIDGYRTRDLFDKNVDDPDKLVGTRLMGDEIVEHLVRQSA